MYGTHCGFFHFCISAECRKIMLSQQILCCLPHGFHIHWPIIVQHILPFKHIRIIRIPDAVHICLFHHIQTAVKSFGRCPHLCHGNIFRQILYKNLSQFLTEFLRCLTRTAGIRKAKICHLSMRMHTGIGAPGTVNLYGTSILSA